MAMLTLRRVLQEPSNRTASGHTGMQCFRGQHWFYVVLGFVLFVLFLSGSGPMSGAVGVGVGASMVMVGMVVFCLSRLVGLIDLLICTGAFMFKKTVGQGRGD